MFNFLELQEQTAILLQRQEDTSYFAKLKAYLNYAQEYAYRVYDYYQELEEKFSFSTVDGQEAYFLPNNFGTPLRFYDHTNAKILKPWTEQSYLDVNIASVRDAVEGRPDKVRLFGISPINQTLAAAVTQIKAKSSLALDNTGTVVLVEGYINAELTVLDFEEITINQTDPTTFDSATSPKTFYAITRVVKSGDTTGYVTIANQADVTLAIIPSMERASRYPVARFGPIPDDAYTVWVLFKKRVLRMIRDTDYPFIDASEFFITYAYAYGLSEQKETLPRSQEMFQKSKDVLFEVIRNQQTRLGDDYQHKMVSSIAQAHRS